MCLWNRWGDKLMSHCLPWAATCEKEREREIAREIVTAISLSATNSLMMSYVPME